MENKVLISVIVPIYNEALVIKENLQLLKNELEEHFSSFEIIVVNDGSTDNGRLVLEEISDSRVRVIDFSTNQGKGIAVKKGFEESRGDYILFIDGGLELHPKEIHIFWGLMQLYHADIIVGSKRHPQSKVFYPWYRKLLSTIYQQFIKVLFNLDVTDTQVGIKMFRRNVIESILPQLETSSYGMDLEILAMAVKRGYKNILEAPIRLDYFLKNDHSVIKDLLHTLRVGTLLLRDTLRLWVKLRKIK